MRRTWLERTARCALVTFAILVCAGTVRAEPYGAPFVMNSTTSVNLATLDNLVAMFDMAMGANGDSIALWQSGPTSAPSFYIRRLDAAGRAFGSVEQNVGSDVRGVAVAGNGSYALVSEASDGAGIGVFATIMNRSGAVVVPRFRVNDTLTGDQRFGDIAMNASGGFVVAWSTTQGRAFQIYAKGFSASGAAMGPEALVYSSTLDSNRLGGVSVALDGSGNSTVTWSSGDINSTIWMDVWARRYGANGAPLSSTFRVNTTTTGAQWFHSAAVSDNGSAVVVWTSDTQDGGDAVFGQRYAANGSLLGGEFRISPDNESGVEGLAVAADPNGGFVVTWHDNAVNGSVVPQIVARSYASSGVATSEPFTVSAATNIFVGDCAIGMDQNGNFLVSWLEHHYTNDPGNRAVGRRFYPTGIAVQPLSNGQVVSNLSGSAGSFRYFKLSVPSGQTTVDASIFGGVGDADLYVRWGALPTVNSWDGRPYLNGNNEQARMLSFPPGDWYIGVRGYSAYSGLGLQARSY